MTSLAIGISNGPEHWIAEVGTFAFFILAIAINLILVCQSFFNHSLQRTRGTQ